MPSSKFSPPPTYADPVITDEMSKKSQFNPLWLKWFLDVANFISVNSGSSGGSVVHDALSGLQGGGANQYYHLTGAEYTGTGTGIFLRQGSPTINAPTIIGTGTSINNPAIIGTTTNDNAAAGDVGEYVSSSFTGVPITGAASNLTSISLTAGDWEVSGGFVVTGSTTNLRTLQVGPSSTSATIGAAGTYTSFDTASATVVLASYGGSVPTSRFSLAATTTVYLVGVVTLTSGTATASGILRARRVR